MLEPKLNNCYITHEEAKHLIEVSKVNVNFNGDEFVIVCTPQANGKDWTAYQWQTTDNQLVRLDEFTTLDGAKAHVQRQIKEWLREELTRD